MTDSPFLTVVTRCYKRPHFLQQNVKSLKSQTDKDYEQVFIIDRVGKGLAAADQVLNVYKELNHGKYVMVLDDDDKVINNRFIEKLKITAKSNSYPDIIIFRGRFGTSSYVLPPLDTNWGKVVSHAKIGSFNYIVKNEIYKKYIHICKTGIAGDFDFISKVLNIGFSTIWMEDIMVSVQMKGKGREIAEVEQRGKHRILRRKNRWKK